jgi:hypothetical protein
MLKNMRPGVERVQKAKAHRHAAGNLTYSCSRPAKSFVKLGASSLMFLFFCSSMSTFCRPPLVSELLDDIWERKERRRKK